MIKKIQIVLVKNLALTMATDFGTIRSENFMEHMLPEQLARMVKTTLEFKVSLMTATFASLLDECLGKVEEERVCQISLKR